jgi:hypothetical protein
MSRLLELGMRLAAEIQERASSDYDFDGRPLEQLSDIELLQILARGQGMTESRFLQIARGQLLQGLFHPKCELRNDKKLKRSGSEPGSGEDERRPVAWLFTVSSTSVYPILQAGRIQGRSATGSSNQPSCLGAEGPVGCTAFA